MAPPITIHKGDVFVTPCGDCRVVRYESSNKVHVEFLKTGYKNQVTADNLRKGEVLDPYYPKSSGIGFLGVGIYSSKDSKLHKLWHHMLTRCYDEAYREKYPTYADCTVVKRWHNFQNFCEDITKMPNWNVKGFDLDKDLRVLGNKKYGPKYCSFVPQEINKILGVKPKRKLPQGISNRKGRYLVNFRSEYIGSYSKLEEAEDSYNKVRNKHIHALVSYYKDKLHQDVFRTLRGFK